MPQNKITAIPFLLAGLLAGIAPWLIGGRAAGAHLWLGSLAWAAAGAVLLVVIFEYRLWKPTAEYEARRGRGTPNPLTVFGRGLLWSLPLWGFIGLMALAALNPAYAREEGVLVQQDFFGWLPLVIDPDRSRPAIFFLTGLVAMLAMLLNPMAMPRRRWIRWIATALLINAVVLAWVGLWYRFAGNGLVLGRFEPRAHYFFATFYYKNHWAAYALLYCGVAAGFFFRDLPRWTHNTRQAGSGALALIAILFLALTLPVSESRSGILLLAIFFLLFTVFLFRRLHSPRGRIALVVAAVVGIAGFSLLSATDLQWNWLRTTKQLDRAGTGLQFDSIRGVHAPEVCFNMFKERPLLGWGYGSYDPLFPVYATDYFRDEAGRLTTDMEFAHNDWLQHIVEFGLLGTGLLVAFLILHWRRSRSHAAPGTGLEPGIAIGLILVGILALWDFPLSNPAVLTNAAVLFMMLIRNHTQASVAPAGFVNLG